MSIIPSNCWLYRALVAPLGRGIGPCRRAGGRDGGVGRGYDVFDARARTIPQILSAVGARHRCSPADGGRRIMAASETGLPDRPHRGVDGFGRHSTSIGCLALTEVVMETNATTAKHLVRSTPQAHREHLPCAFSSTEKIAPYSSNCMKTSQCRESRQFRPDSRGIYEISASVPFRRGAFEREGWFLVNRRKSGETGC
jgi:hypothetical protein